MADQQRLLRQTFAAHRGEEIDSQGDSFFVAFRSAADALSAAVAIQRALAAHHWPDGAEPQVRIGIHSGEAAAAGERYVGFSVHRAARIGAAAHGGQILLSDATRALVEDDLPEGVSLRDLGRVQLKDIDRPERISQLAAEGLRLEFPPLRGAGPAAPSPLLRRRSLALATLAGVVAAAVAIPVFFLGGGSVSAAALTGVEGNAVGAIDLASGRVLHSIGVGTSPSAVAVGKDAVWVVNAGDDSVSRIDPQTNASTQTIPVGSGPGGIAVGGRFVWVANSLDGTVSKIDPNANGGSGGEVERIPVGNGPAGVAFGAGGVWVANSTDRTVVRIDPRSGTVGRPLPVDAGADAIAVGRGGVWVTSESAGSVARIDPATGSVIQTINVGSGPAAVAVGAGSVWVANSVDGTVSRIDPGTNKVAGLVRVGEGPSGVAVMPDGKAVWVSNELGGTLSRIDPAQDKVVQTVATENRPKGVAVGANTLYVAVRSSGLAHRGGTLTVAQTGYQTRKIPSEADLIDWSRGYVAWELVLSTNDGLVAFERAGGSEGSRLVADLATALPTPTDGGRTYTFQLRPGIRYSTGALVRPADFRRAIERALLNSGLSTGFPPSYFAGIVGADRCLKAKTKRCDLSQGIVADAKASTVSFHLTVPDPDFPYKLALPPADAVPASTPLKARLPLPATGPYTVGRATTPSMVCSGWCGTVNSTNGRRRRSRTASRM